MDRTLRRLILALAGTANLVCAQESTPSPTAASPTPAHTPAPVARATPGPRRPDQFEDALRIFQKFLPEERQRFGENLQRWKDMSPAEQDALRDREQFRREKIAQEIDESIRKAGLKLDPDQREVYALRYGQERRKIEEKLRKEMDDKRRPMLQEMLNRLKTEFAAPAVSPSPAASAKP